MAMNRYRNEYGPSKPKRPRRRTLKRYVAVRRAKAVRGKNAAALIKAVNEVSGKHSIDPSKITVRGSWYGSPELEWTTPETDKEFESRKAAEEKEFKRAMRIYETDKKRYDEYQEQQSMVEIKSAVNSHEAAVNTIAEVLKRYPDVLDKAVSKAVKGK